MIDYRIKGRPLLRFITKGSIGLEASRKGIEEMQGVQNPIS